MMEKGNFNQLVRTLRNWSNEAIIIKRDTAIIPKGKERPKLKIRPETHGDSGVK
jgi:hypothetical protein